MAPGESAVPATGADQRRRTVFNALATGLLLASGAVFLAAPAIGFSNLGARISLILSTVTLFLGLLSLWDLVLIISNKPTLDVTLPPPLSGLLGGVTAIAVGLLIGRTIFT